MSWQLASFTLLAAALIAGFAWWERSRPSSRTVALVATLAALATLGRIAFAALPNVKPTTDIVLIAGYTLGGAPGFAVGATSAIASNVFFGEGPWTPWQMLAWGLVGLAGAALARSGRRIPRLPMALICAAAGFAYGLVLNFSTWVTFTGQHTLAQFLLIEGQAVPFDLAHAAGNFVFYLAFGPALIRALRRFRLRLDARFVPAAALALVLLAAVPAHARESVVARQIAYLHRAQNADGGFGGGLRSSPSQLFTAWAVIGLAAAGAPTAAPAHWIEGHLAELQGPGDIERTILALVAAHAPLHDLVGRLERYESKDGSFSERSNLTAFAILALRAARASAGPRASYWLARQENPDGGFAFATRGSTSDVDDTAAAVQALAPDDIPERAIGYLERAVNHDGGFPQQPGGPSNAQSTAWALQALIAADAGRKGAAYLTRLTTPSGAVDYSAGAAQTPVWVTAQALAALAGKPL